MKVTIVTSAEDTRPDEVVIFVSHKSVAQVRKMFVDSFVENDFVNRSDAKEIVDEKYTFQSHKVEATL